MLNVPSTNRRSGRLSMTDVGIAEALVGKENMLAEADVTADAIVEAEHPVCNEKHSAGRNNKRPAEDDAAEPENKARAVDNNDNGKSPEKDGEEEEEEEEIPVDDDGGKDTQDDTPMVDGNAIDDQAQKTDEDAKANADTVAEDEKEGPGDSAAKVDLKRPVKRARSAYFVFIDERRAEVQKQHPGEGVAAVARALGLAWSSMTDAEKLPYQQQAAKEREQVAAATEAWKAAGGVATIDDCKTLDSTNNGSLIFPVARIRKICKLDPDVRGLSKEAVLLVTKAAELATARLGLECVKTASIQNRRKLLPEDVAQVCAAREQFLFLREDITDLHRQQQKEASTKTVTSSKGKSTVDSAAAKNSKPLTDYFKPA